MDSKCINKGRLIVSCIVLLLSIALTIVFALVLAGVINVGGKKKNKNNIATPSSPSSPSTPSSSSSSSSSSSPPESPPESPVESPPPSPLPDVTATA